MNKVCFSCPPLGCFWISLFGHRRSSPSFPFSAPSALHHICIPAFFASSFSSPSLTSYMRPCHFTPPIPSSLPIRISSSIASAGWLISITFNYFMFYLLASCFLIVLFTYISPRSSILPLVRSLSISLRSPLLRYPPKVYLRCIFFSTPRFHYSMFNVRCAAGPRRVHWHLLVISFLFRLDHLPSHGPN